MKQIVFGKSVQGASHKRSGKECQDSKKSIVCADGTIIMSVADGHGSDSCPYSKSGSTIAVNVFCKIMKELYDSYAESQEMLLTYLNREGDTKVAYSIDFEWKRRVLKAHSNKKRETPRNEDGEKIKEDIYKLYGTTLVGVMITSKYIFALQLGDGDISYVDKNGFNLVLQSEKILGIETHSLSKCDSWKKMISAVRRWDCSENLPSVIMLSTDGFSNSYKNEVEFQKTCIEYFDVIKEHGVDVVASNLETWLAETSEMGCGDDITLLIAYSFDESVEFQKEIPEEDQVDESELPDSESTGVWNHD